MKTLLLVLISLASYSQVVSLKITNLQPLDKSNNISPYSGYSLESNYQFTDAKFSPVAGLNLTSYKFSNKSIITDEYGNKIGTILNYQSASYLGVNLGVKYNITKTILVPYILLSVNSLFKVSESNSKTANSFILSPSLTAGLKYNITDNLNSHLELGYSRPLNNIYDTYGGLQYNSVNISLGIGYKIK